MKSVSSDNIAERDVFPGYAVSFPTLENGELTQDEEYCLVKTDRWERRIRFHDYGEVYNIPGLYEHIFYEKLECQSPSIMGKLLDHEVSRQGMEMEALSVLDVGAGNGIMGEVLSESGVNSLVGVDILPEAAKAAERDRPGLYDAYYPVNLLQPPVEVWEQLESTEFNCLTMIAALGFGDIPPPVFATAFNLIADGGFVTFNLKEDFLEAKDPTGFAGLIRKMSVEEQMDIRVEVRYVHRLSISGEPLFYRGIVGQKLTDLPAIEMVA